MVVEKSDLTPDFITNSMPTVGIRVPNHVGFQKLCQSIEGGVLATTSANISNERTSVLKEEVENSIGDKLFKIFGDDKTCEGVASTVIYVGADNSIKVLRQGSISLEDLI